LIHPLNLKILEEKMDKYLEALLEIGIYNVGLTISELLEELDDNETIEKPAPIKQDMTILEKDDLLSRLYSYAETCYNRELLEYEKTMISEWFDSGYSYDQISKAIFDSLKAKKMHLQYANSLLYSRTTRPTTEIDPELKAMMDSVFKKSA